MTVNHGCIENVYQKVKNVIEPFYSKKRKRTNTTPPIKVLMFNILGLWIYLTTVYAKVYRASTYLLPVCTYAYVVTIYTNLLKLCKGIVICEAVILIIRQFWNILMSWTLLNHWTKHKKSNKYKLIQKTTDIVFPNFTQNEVNKLTVFLQSLYFKEI